MIRSAYEAVTNSCMPFLMDNKKNSQRVPLFGALHKRGLLGYDGKKWVLYKTEVELEEVIVFPLYKINGHYYVPSLESVKNNEDNYKKNKDGTYKYKIMRVLNEVPDETDKALNDAFQAKEYDGNKKIRYGVTITRGYGKNKWNVSDGEEKIEIDKDGNVETYFFVRINVDGENANKVDVSWINKKPGEEDNRGVLQYNVPVNLSRIYHVAYLKKAVSAEDGATIFDTEKVWPESGAEENEEAYKKLLSALQRDGTERYKKGKRVNKQPNKECNEALEKALKEACKDPNQLVPVYYFGVKTGAGGENDKEVYMSGSAAGRIAQRRKWEDIFGGHLPCRGNRFCPACLLFGTSSDDDEYGMKGHVRFSDAFLSSPVEGKITNLHTLPILATPKSTAFEFYLRRPMEDAIYWNYDFYEKKEDKDKDAKNEFYHLPKATPRGRKMYWHHKHFLPDGYGKSNDCKKSKMNCTAEVMNAGKTFSFDVYFDQITSKQLKELIWVITLGENQSDSNLQHKLGHAKPLGYGSVKLIIDKEKSMIREFKFAEGGACRYMIRSFAESKEFGGDSIETPFDSDVEPVKSFLIMCNTHTIEDKIKIDYPRMKAGGEIFKWFGKNRENASRLKTLPYPWEEAYLDSNYEEEIETMDSED